MPGLDIPVELGAEFLHGEARVTHSLLRRAGIATVESTRSQRALQNGRLRPINAFAEAQRAMKGASLKRDVSFDDFLKGIEVSKKTKSFARMMVQGFDAADPRRVSARSIAEEWGEGGELGDSQPRPRGGYGALMDWLARRVPVRLQTRVQRVAWKRGAVTVHARFIDQPFVVRARRAIVTLPLGVLQANAVRFSPSLGKTSVLKKLASGPVIRVAMRFSEAFWERRAPGVAFFHNPKAPFPTFWTPLPMRAPLLTAWAGGPKAARLSGRTDLVQQAFASVKSVFRSPATLMDARVQDWRADPFARGGYSYVLVGGEGAREELAAPIGETIFLAGEATDSEEAGTVAGALRSGTRAARQAL